MTRGEPVRQEAWGLLLPHFAIHGLMHEAALCALRERGSRIRFRSPMPCASLVEPCRSRPFPPRHACTGSFGMSSGAGRQLEARPECSPQRETKDGRYHLRPRDSQSILRVDYSPHIA